MARRVNFLFVVLFLGVAAVAWLHSRPIPVALELAKQIGALDRAAAIKAGIDLLPAPSSPEEAKERLADFDRYLAADRGAGWENFRSWMGRRGKPEAVAAGDRVWNEYRQAADALRTFLVRQSEASDADTRQPALQIKMAEDYMVSLNRLRAAEDALTKWAAGLSQADFR